MKKFLTLLVLSAVGYTSAHAQCAASASYFEMRIVDAHTAPLTDYVIQMRYVSAGPPDFGSDPTGASSLCSTVIPDAGGANPSFNGGVVFSISWDAAASPTYAPTNGLNPSGGTLDNSSGMEFASNPFLFTKGFATPQAFGGKLYQDYGDGAAAVNSFGTWVDGQWYNVWRISGTGMAAGFYPEIVPATDPWFTSVSNGCPYIAQLDATNFPICEAGFKPSVVLPITLQSFTGVKDANTSLLKWITQSEENMNHFVVERSNDGITFTTTVGEVKTKAIGGNSTSTLDYNLVDKTPRAGHNYYRLKSVDNNGKSFYSNVVDLYFESGNSVSIYPNPVVEELNIDIDALASTQATVKIVDVTGKIVKSIDYKLEKGQNNTSVNLADIAAGSYFVKITDGKSINFTQQVQKL